MDLILGFANETLLFTNIWILLYNNILKFLNTRFPVQSTTIIKFIRSDFSPEPYEIPLFLILTFAAVITIFLYHRFIKVQLKKILPIRLPRYVFLAIKLLLLIFLTTLFVENIGGYPMAHDIYPYTTSETPTTYHLFLFFYLVIITFILLEAAVLQKMIQKKGTVLIFFMSLILLVITVVTFEPRFPMVGHDYSFFFGPIWEIANGKTIYTDAPALYGFISTLLFTALYKIGILNIWHLPAIVWFLYIAEYFLCFYLIYKISKSLVLGLIALFSIITINYFSIFLLPATIPQTGPLRWLPMIIAICLIYRFKRLDSKYVLFSFPLLVFWFLDSGIFLAMSYFFSLFILFIDKRLNLKRFLIYPLGFIGISIGFFIFINVFQMILGYKFIDIFLLFKKIREFALVGFGMLPMPEKSYFWLVIFIYFSSLIYLFKNQLNNANYQLLLFSSNILLFASIYFVGRSHPHNLFHISTFAILHWFILFAYLTIKINSRLRKFIFYFALFTMMVVFPAYERQEILTKTIKEKISRFGQGDIFKPESENFLKTKYKDDIAMINQSIPNKKIIILSDDDTYLFYLTGKQNLLNYNPQVINIAKDDFQYSLKEAVLKCPKKIAVDCKVFDKCSQNSPFTDPFFNSANIFLNQIQNSCHLTYFATTCTANLCIGLAK